MLGQLKGILEYQNHDELIIDVHGVGYVVQVSGTVLAELGGVGSEIKLVIYTDVRENSISLFGFSTILEKQVFLLTKKVKGLGSKLAMNVISTLGAEKLLVAIGRGDTEALKKVSGIGKKMAERIIVELREQVISFVKEVRGENLDSNADNVEVLGFKNQPLSKSHPANLILTPSLENDAILALEKLGVHSEKAKQAVASALVANLKIKDSGELVRLALSNL
ncbi:MAG: Holliday junction branch migration protein RuvA [Deltaproteobacteria bacterium]|jgi:Holliday junction DNA helicase RuvA|nr:Holliday junction branch migration protein RuvA [Deltaproteobacteria bacterium]